MKSNGSENDSMQNEKIWGLCTRYSSDICSECSAHRGRDATHNLSLRPNRAATSQHCIAIAGSSQSDCATRVKARSRNRQIKTRSLAVRRAEGGDGRRRVRKRVGFRHRALSRCCPIADGGCSETNFQIAAATLRKSTGDLRVDPRLNDARPIRITDRDAAIRSGDGL